MIGDSLPQIITQIPGPLSQAWIDRLAMRECPAITARRSRRAQRLGTASNDPIVWQEAVGANVIDVDGNLFVDMTGFDIPQEAMGSFDSKVQRMHEYMIGLADAIYGSFICGSVLALPSTLPHG